MAVDFFILAQKMARLKTRSSLPIAALAVLSGSFSAKAQEIGPSKSFAPAAATTIAPPSSSLGQSESPFKFEKKRDDNPLVNETPISMTPKERFVNANEPWLKKLQKTPGVGNERMRALRQNQSMGEIQTLSKKVTIAYRDSEDVDGDLVKIYVNGNIARSSVMLMGDFRGFEIELQPGFNTIEFEALNQGEAGPNTAQMIVNDEKGMMIGSGTWNLATGFKASLLVVHN